MTSINARRRRTRARPTADSDTQRGSLLNQTAEYALRAVAYMATQPNDEALTSRELSRKTGVPSAYLSKILRRLVAAGLLSSEKGHRGGFRLRRPASQIRLRDVLAAVDQVPASNRCAFGWGACDPNQPCPLHPVWAKLELAFIDWSERTTLAEIGRAPAQRSLVRAR